MPLNNEGNAKDATKQKIMIGVIVVILLIVGWQVVGLFGGSSEPAPTPAPVKTTTVTKTGGAPNNQAARPAGTPASDEALPPREARIAASPELLKLQQDTQAKYVAALNELQLLKVEREIAETNQAITASKLATVTAEQSISDLLVKPVPVVAPPVMVTPQAEISSKTTKTITTIPDVSYSVVSISMQDHHWAAVLSAQGKLFSVNVGDVLAADGSVVTSINAEEVVLSKNDKKTTLRIVGGV